MIPQLLADLHVRHALASHRQHVHELLLRHHEQRSLQPFCRCLVARQAGGTNRSPVGSQEEHGAPGTATFTDRRPRDSVIAHIAHLRHRSVRVDVGDRVRAGDTIAECGNSGNSTEPHTHVQA
ncbi:MAG: M23 family metallopeptidase, partial [Ilumatobacteraceae bacterium]|nr:M23 family metallopeptidase [Ilumatobacteraceae bacterium]